MNYFNEFSKYPYSLALLLSVATGVLCASKAAEAATRPALDRPNVILVFLDDAGYGDFAHHGNPTIETPTISRLAWEGAQFTQFYTSSPACSASRYSLLTGRCRVGPVLDHG